MGVPDDFTVHIAGPIGPVTTDLAVKSPLPKLTVGVDKLAVGLDPLAVAVAVKELPEIKIEAKPLKIEPVDLNLAITKIPDVRAHIPADFTVGMRVLGFELFAIRLTGEAQIITEPYVRNPCEVTDAYPHRPALEPLPPADG